MARSLEGCVAVVAGATRGAGRGIARMLGEAGATVYCTGRSSRAQPNTTDDRDGFGVTEANWRDVVEKPQAKAAGWGGSETPCFVGRAVAALAADPHVARKNGGIYTAWSLPEEYGFTDVDGARPDQAILADAFDQARKTYLAPLTEAAKRVSIDWKLVAK